MKCKETLNGQLMNFYFHLGVKYINIGPPYASKASHLQYQICSSCAITNPLYMLHVVKIK